MMRMTRMAQWMGCLLAGVVLMAWVGSAQAIEGLSGSTWGTVLYSFGHDDLQSMGHLKQGIDWWERQGYRFTTYTALRWRYQSNEGQFFNAFGPALGAEIKKGPISVGAEYYWEHTQASNDPGNENNRALIFVDWYYDWDLLKLFR